MTALYFWGAFFVVTPAAILYLTRTFETAARVGAIVIAYLFGLIVGNIGVFPENIGSVQNVLVSGAVPLALPLLFFSLDLRRWREMARPTVVSLFAGLVAILVSSVLMFLTFGWMIGDEAWKAGGMLVGVYTGGTPNLAAIGNALGVDPVTYVAVHGSDVLGSGVLLMFLVAIAPALYGKVLKPFVPFAPAGGTVDADRPVAAPVPGSEFSPHFTGWSRPERHEMGIGFALALAIAAVGGSFLFFMKETNALPATMLTITSLGVLASFNRRIRALRNTFQLGHYLILIFSLAVSSMANVRELTVGAPLVVLYVALLLVVSSVIHLAIARIFGVDRDTHIIAVTAFVYSPPFIPLIAGALKNRDIVLPGVVLGVTGWIMGNYVGFAIAYLLRWLG